MTHFIVVEEQGELWDDKLSMREQKGWSEHAAFMDALESEHFVVLGGPLRDYPKHKALLVISGPTEQDVRMKLAEDPWMRAGVLRILETYRWEILLGRLP